MNWSEWTLNILLDITLGWLSFFALLGVIFIIGWCINKAGL